MSLKNEGLSASSVARISELACAYASGTQGAAAHLIEQVDEDMVQSLPHEIRAALMDAIMVGTEKLDERSINLLRAALYATTDESYLSTRGQAYLENNEQMAAETLLEWRVVLQAKNHKGSPAHIDSIMHLADVYQSGSKTTEASDLRSHAANLLESKGASAASLTQIAQQCFDSADLINAERIAKLALVKLQSRNDESLELVDCLRLLHALAHRQKRSSEAKAIAKRIQKLLGISSIDEIERTLNTYVNMPDKFDLKLRPDGIEILTDDFPRVIHESSGLDLQKYFMDAFAQMEELSPEERSKLAVDLYQVLHAVTEFSTGLDGAKLTRPALTEIDLPPGLSQGFIQKVIFDTTVKFKLLPNPPDEVTFADVQGITFSVGGKLFSVPEFNLKAEGNLCLVTPLINQCGQVKQSAANTFEMLKNTGKDFLVAMFLKTQKVCIKLPIVLDEYRQYLADAINFRLALRYNEKDLLSFFERCSRIEVDDPFMRSLLHGGMRVNKTSDKILLERVRTSVCDLQGVELKIAKEVKLRLLKKTDELSIKKLTGIDVRVPFDAPSELAVIGLDLKRSLPTRLESLKLSAPDKENHRRMIAGTAPGRWISFDLDEDMKPAADKLGDWVIVGVTSNPISGAPQNFFLRLDKKNQLKMNSREVGALINQTAMEGFDGSDPMTWQWGAVAIGTQTLLTAGSILRATIGDDETDELIEEVKGIAKSIFGKLF